MNSVRIVDEKGKFTRIRGEVVAFAEDMERKLKLNDHKGRWHAESLSYLFSRLHEKLTELEAAIMLIRSSDHESVQHVVNEAADVGNFAMMIADNAKLGEDPL
jgi:hypothetical protein